MEQRTEKPDLLSTFKVFKDFSKYLFRGIMQIKLCCLGKFAFYKIHNV